MNKNLIVRLSVAKSMKRMLCMLVVMIVSHLAFGQEETPKFTLYNEFKPAIVKMASGNKVRVSLANIFLKNATLLFKKGDVTMEANMDGIIGVTFGDDEYVKIDNMLAMLVDTVKSSSLYCVTLIDIDSYKTMLQNNVNISSLSFGDVMSYTTIDLNSEEAKKLPLIRQYYFLYNGKIMRAHEREVSRRLPKDKKRLYQTVLTMDGFAWENVESLLMMLKAISD